MSKASEQQDRGAEQAKVRLEAAAATGSARPAEAKPAPAGERQGRTVRRILGDYSEQTGAHFG